MTFASFIYQPCKWCTYTVAYHQEQKQRLEAEVIRLEAEVARYIHHGADAQADRDAAEEALAAVAEALGVPEGQDIIQAAREASMASQSVRDFEEAWEVLCSRDAVAMESALLYAIRDVGMKLADAFQAADMPTAARHARVRETIQELHTAGFVAF